jgi:hypothetical protein
MMIDFDSYRKSPSICSICWDVGCNDSIYVHLDQTDDIFLSFLEAKVSTTTPRDSLSLNLDMQSVNMGRQREIMPSTFFDESLSSFIKQRMFHAHASPFLDLVSSSLY